MSLLQLHIPRRMMGLGSMGVGVLGLILGPPGATQLWGATQETLLFESDSITVGDPALSKDGRWIVFSGSASPERTALFVMPAAGGKAHQITNNRYNDEHPVWSPDGRTLYFFSDRSTDSGGALFRIMRLPFDPETGEAQGTPRVVSLDDPSGSLRTGPAVSPDGQWIAYLVRQPGDRLNHQIRVVPSIGGAPQTIAEVQFGTVHWAGDSRHLLFSESQAASPSKGMYRVPLLAGGDPELLFPLGESQYLVDVSGDGKRILWSRFPEGEERSVYEVTDLQGTVIASPDLHAMARLSFDGFSLLQARGESADVLMGTPLNGGPARVLKGGVYDNEPIGWTADGRVLVKTDGLRGEQDGYSLVDPRTGSIEDLSSPPANAVIRAIHPNGLHVFYTVSRPGGPEVPIRYDSWIWDLGTGEKKQVSTNPGCCYVVGRGGSDYLDGDRFLFVNGGPTGPELWAVRPESEPEFLWEFPDELIKSGPFFDGAAEAVAVHGNRIAWVRSGETMDSVPQTRSTVMVTDLSTGLDTEVISLAGGVLEEVMWSPDGRRLAFFYGGDDPNRPKHAFLEVDEDLHPVGEFLLVDSPGHSFWNTQWTPDSRSLVLVAMGASGVNDMAAWLIPSRPGAVPQNLTEDDPHLSVTSSLSPDGSLLAYASERLIRSTIWRIDLGPPQGSLRQR